MKNFILFIVAFIVVTATIAQKRPDVRESLKNYSVELNVSQITDGSEDYSGIVSPYKSSNLFTEVEIGDTYYDKQSNRCVMNRIYRYSDGTIGATWMRGNEVSTFNDRGTAYNYFDGNDWGEWPSARIESQKSGWPSLAPLGENGEIVVSHNAVDALIVNRRDEKGTGTWVETFIQGPPGYLKVTWPRVVTSGVDNQTVHILGQIRDGYQGQPIALAYYRSTDGGENWDISNYVFEEVGPDYYTEIGADAQVWAEPRAGVLAFACFNVWHDLFIYKSTDEGDTWEKTVVWENPYPFYNDETIFTDTLWAPDNSGAIALDSDGKVHLVFGLAFVAHFEAGTTYSYWPGLSNGIAYWNEDMPPFEAENQHDALDPYDELIEDVNLIGWSQDLNGNGQLDFTDDIIAYTEIGLCTMPNIVIDEFNRVFVVWAATTEGYDNGINNYKHIWVRSSHDNGIIWGNFYDITDDLVHIFDECIYPVFAANSDDDLYLMYNVDLEPGCAVDGDHDYVQNREFFVNIGKDEVLGINDHFDISRVNLSQNYPNPFSNETYIKVNSGSAGLVTIEITDLLGSKIYETPVKFNSAGSQIIKISADIMPPGIYIYSVVSGNQKISRKMMVE
jgi:hypothetical protein